MANHKSALKRAKQNVKRRERNRHIKGTYRTEVKGFIALVEAGKKDEATALLPSLHKTIDMAQTKGAIKKNAASRKKSRMTLLLNKAIAS